MNTTNYLRICFSNHSNRVLNTVVKILETLTDPGATSRSDQVPSVVTKTKRPVSAAIVVNVLNFVLSIPGISLKLHNAIDGSIVDFAIKSLCLTVHQRNVDSSISFDVGALSISDNLGKMIMWTNFGSSRRVSMCETPDSSQKDSKLVSFTDDISVGLDHSSMSSPPDDRAKVLYAREAEREDELSLQCGQVA